MPRTSTVLNRLRKICLALPETEETVTWGKPHFRVRGKIFAGFGEEDGKAVIGLKLSPGRADSIVEDPRFRPAPYVGHKGWVSMDATGVRDWYEVRSLVRESYGLIAPKRTLAKLESSEAAAPPAAKKTAMRKSRARRGSPS